MLSSQPMLAVRVREVRHPAIDVLSLVLAPVDGGPLPACTAGAHIDVALPMDRIRQIAGMSVPMLRDAVRACAVHKDPRFSDHAPFVVDYALGAGKR